MLFKKAKKGDKRKLIMLVEDEDAIAEKTLSMIHNIKDEWGHQKYDAIHAQNGEEALELLHKNRRFMNIGDNKIDCILLDLRMPVMDGPQFLKKLREMETNNILVHYIPVVFLSAYEDDDKWKSAVQGVATAYLKKPVSQIKLEDILYRILENWDGETLMEFTREKGIQKLEEYQKEKS